MSQYSAIKFITRFIVGGFIVVSTDYVAEQIGPTLGALWWAFPFTLLPTMYFMHQNGQKKGFIASFIYTAAWANILLMFVLFSLSYFLRTGNNFYFDIGKGVLVWITGALLVYYFLL
jgi:hypothetical protein